MQPFRFFSTTASRLINFVGYDPTNLSKVWFGAFNKFIEPGGSAEKKLGKVKEVEIMTKTGTNSPVHRSHFNRLDTESVIAARIVGSKGSKVCHIYKDGTGTSAKGDVRE
ncbi:hypothetical protein SVAN01_05073 [Stagonosporopsis vannaccii]|nr:hypothetical protein SVAN01_05073 [Stagonosporopsis vannaccii]